MSRRDFFIVVLKFLAIYCIFPAILSAASIVYSILMMTSKNPLFQQFSFGPQIAHECIKLSLLVIFILLIFKYDRRIAERIIPTDEDVHLSAGKNWQKEIFTLALRILGFLDLVKYFPLLLGTFIEMPTFNKLQEKNSIGTLVFYLIMTSIAVYLVLGAQHFNDWVFRQKAAKPPEPVPESMDIRILEQINTIHSEDEPEKK